MLFRSALLNGIDLEPYRAARGRREKRRRELDIGPDTYHIIHTARLEPHKQPGRVLRAVATAAQDPDHPLGEWRLTYVGGGSLRERLEKELMEIDQRLQAQGREPMSPRVHFAGWSDDVAGWLASADAFVLGSRNEGLGLTVVEAMAAGAVPIASDIVGPREVVEHEREGLLVPVEGDKDILEALVRVRNDEELRERLVEGGSKKAELFSIERYVREAEQIYEEVLETKPSLSRRPVNGFRERMIFWKFHRLAKKGR